MSTPQFCVGDAGASVYSGNGRDQHGSCHCWGLILEHIGFIASHNTVTESWPSDVRCELCALCELSVLVKAP